MSPSTGSFVHGNSPVAGQYDIYDQVLSFHQLNAIAYLTEPSDAKPTTRIATGAKPSTLRTRGNCQ